MSDHDGQIKHDGALVACLLAGMSAEAVGEAFATRDVGIVLRRYFTADGTLRPGARELLGLPTVLPNSLNL